MHNIYLYIYTIINNTEIHRNIHPDNTCPNNDFCSRVSCKFAIRIYSCKFATWIHIYIIIHIDMCHENSQYNMYIRIFHNTSRYEYVDIQLYGVATMSRHLKIVGLFCRISSFL